MDSCICSEGIRFLEAPEEDHWPAFWDYFYEEGRQAIAVYGPWVSPRPSSRRTP